LEIVLVVVLVLEETPRESPLKSLLLQGGRLFTSAVVKPEKLQ
jgi:hypothetical protein